MLTDTNGRPYKKLSDARAGDWIEVDGGFTCIVGGTKRKLIQADDGLYFRCAEGRHYLAGQ